MSSQYIERYVVHKTAFDWFPVIFQSTCERTLPSLRFPNGEGLYELMERCDKAGYEVLNFLPEWATNKRT